MLLLSHLIGNRFRNHRDSLFWVHLNQPTRDKRQIVNNCICIFNLLLLRLLTTSILLHLIAVCFIRIRRLHANTCIFLTTYSFVQSFFLNLRLYRKFQWSYEDNSRRIASCVVMVRTQNSEFIGTGFDSQEQMYVLFLEITSWKFDWNYTKRSYIKVPFHRKRNTTMVARAKNALKTTAQAKRDISKCRLYYITSWNRRYFAASPQLWLHLWNQMGSVAGFSNRRNASAIRNNRRENRAWIYSYTPVVCKRSRKE